MFKDQVRGPSIGRDNDRTILAINCPAAVISLLFTRNPFSFFICQQKTHLHTFDTVKHQQIKEMKISFAMLKGHL